MKPFRNAFILAGIQVMTILVTVSSFAQDDPPPPKTVTTELAPGIYQIYYNSVVSLVAFTGPDRLTIYFNGDSVQLIHLPGGHTGGDAIVWFPKGKVLVMGDLIFADNFPYVDLEHGGNAVKYVDNLDWVIQNFPEDITIVPGHGRIYTMADFKAWQSALRKTVDLIIDQQAQGLSAGDMKQKKILSDYASFGKWWITEDLWIDTVVKSLN
ncbi:MAG: MBL fold metallo-hydrolase [bacterium]